MLMVLDVCWDVRRGRHTDADDAGLVAKPVCFPVLSLWLYDDVDSLVPMMLRQISAGCCLRCTVPVVVVDAGRCSQMQGATTRDATFVSP